MSGSAAKALTKGRAEVAVDPDDPTFGVDWPIPVTEISDKDASWPYL